MITITSSVFNIFKGEGAGRDLYNHFMSMIIFTLIMKHIFV